MEVTINDPNTEDTVEADKKSKLESDLFHEQMQEELKELNRASQFRNALLEHSKYVLNVTKFIIPASIIVLVWHYSTPTWLGWLTPTQTESLQSVAYGGFVISSISLAAQQFLQSRNSSAIRISPRDQRKMQMPEKPTGHEQ